VPGSIEVTIYDIAAAAPRDCDFSLLMHFSTNYQTKLNAAQMPRSHSA
jgi:hypothetical protein